MMGVTAGNIIINTSIMFVKTIGKVKNLIKKLKFKWKAYWYNKRRRANLIQYM